MPELTTLRCQHQHRLADDSARFAGRACGAQIGRTPLPCEPTGVTVPGLGAQLDERMVHVWCHRCKAWSQYRPLWGQILRLAAGRRRVA